MREKTTPRCPSELELDRWALDGRPADHAVPEHALGCPACAARLVALDRASAIVAPPVFARNVQDVLDRAEARRPLRPRPWAWLLELQPRWILATAAAACLVLVLANLGPSPVEGPAGSGASGPAPSAVEGWKAGQDVTLQVLAGGEPSPAGATLAPGVVLTMRLTVARPGHLALVSLEQGGRVSRVLPARGARPTPVTPGVVTVQGGVAAAAGVERLYVLFDLRPFDLDDALRDMPSLARADRGQASGEGAGPRVVATWWFRHGEARP